MDDLEQKLRHALERKAAPDSLEARVHAALAARPAPAARRWFSLTPALRWAVAAMAAVLIIAGLWEQQRAAERRAAGEAAKRQLMTALQITGSKLHTIQAKIEAVSYGHEERAQ